MNTTNTTTRRAMFGALAATAVTIPVAARAALSAGAATPAFAGLGDELQRRWAAYALQRPIYEAAVEQANELEYQALINHPRGLSLDDDWDEYWGLVNAEREKVNFAPIELADDQTHHSVWETIETIEGLTPASIYDLAATANAAACAEPRLWEDDPKPEFPL